MKELKMFINGKFEENVSGKWINVLNPSTEEITCLMPDGTADDARRAIDAAAAAQRGGRESHKEYFFHGFFIFGVL